MSPGPKKKAPRRRLPLPYWIREFPLIRTAAVTFAGTAGIAIACVFATHWHLQAARDRESYQQHLRNLAQQNFVQAESEKQEIRLYQPQFLTLQRLGFVGSENRLAWVEAIRQIQEQRRLLPLTYEIEPQQPYRVEGRLATGDYQLRGSRMALHMDLLHELDLLYFLTDLRQRGVFAVQGCELRRTASAGNAPLAPSLTADCVLNWLTLTRQPPARGARP
ncbi:hypothetical protein [Massilia endophytica]|uniref:hypothetical protein n=1 Tax=Massilia endophytica TaxID=2899220 RepID=UPI001E60A384|nr:hypothetical protein [Massilia endophytica]UGQ48361.1 hypothetical protein LSQ66_07805 [Massilia endophytica]